MAHRVIWKCSEQAFYLMESGNGLGWKGYQRWSKSHSWDLACCYLGTTLGWETIADSGAIFERCLFLTLHQLLELFVADPSCSVPW